MSQRNNLNFVRADCVKLSHIRIKYMTRLWRTAMFGYEIKKLRWGTPSQFVFIIYNTDGDVIILKALKCITIVIMFYLQYSQYIIIYPKKAFIMQTCWVHFQYFLLSYITELLTVMKNIVVTHYTVKWRSSISNISNKVIIIFRK